MIAGTAVIVATIPRSNALQPELVLEVEAQEQRRREQREPERGHPDEEVVEAADLAQALERDRQRDRQLVGLGRELLTQHRPHLVTASPRLFDRQGRQRDRQRDEAEDRERPTPAGRIAGDRGGGAGEERRDHRADRLHSTEERENLRPCRDRIRVDEQRPVHRERGRLPEPGAETRKEHLQRVLHEPGEQDDQRPAEHRDRDEVLAGQAVRQRRHRYRAEDEQHAGRPADRAEDRVRHADRILDVRREDVEHRVVELFDRPERRDDRDRARTADTNRFTQRHRVAVDARELGVREQGLRDHGRLGATFLFLDDGRYERRRGICRVGMRLDADRPCCPGALAYPTSIGSSSSVGSNVSVLAEYWERNT